MSGPEHPFYPEKGRSSLTRGWTSCLIFFVVFVVLILFVFFAVVRPS
jgi:hypothetical protein